MRVPASDMYDDCPFSFKYGFILPATIGGRDFDRIIYSKITIGGCSAGDGQDIRGEKQDVPGDVHTCVVQSRVVSHALCCFAYEEHRWGAWRV